MRAWQGCSASLGPGKAEEKVPQQAWGVEGSPLTRGTQHGEWGPPRPRGRFPP